MQAGDVDVALHGEGDAPQRPAAGPLVGQPGGGGPQLGRRHQVDPGGVGGLPPQGDDGVDYVGGRPPTGGEPLPLRPAGGMVASAGLRPVGPGDQLVLDVEFLKERRGIAKFTGVATVDGEVVCTAELMCAKREV